ncbi:MAG: hypothetical protein E3J72_02825 [Planctomycetota bacterium]|nr:MAG: hypothetical protein E3J72_02825 [Planctomycetota bacterium]
MKLKLVIFGALAFTFVFAGLASADEVKWGKLQSALKQGIVRNRPEDVKKALIPLVNAGGKKAVDIVVGAIDKIPGMQDQIYWMLVSAITTITDPPGIDALADAIISHKGSLSRDLMFGLQTNRSLEVVALYERVLLKCAQDIQKMAVEQLVNIGKDECVESLLEGLKSVRDKLIKEEIVIALKMLTGADVGTSYRDWKQYWDEAKNQGLPRPEGEDADNSGFGGGFRTGLSRYRKKQAIGIEGLGPLAALVITARCDNRSGSAICFDQLEATLSQMRIKNTVIRRIKFEEKGYKIPKDTIAVFINCVQIHPHCVCPTCEVGKTKHNRLYP